MKDSREKNEPLYATFRDLALCISLGCVNIIAFALLMAFTSFHPYPTVAILITLYIVEVLIICLKRKEQRTHAPIASLEELLKSEAAVTFRNSDKPAIVLDSYGTVLWYNEALHKILDEHGNYVEGNIASLIDKPITKDNFGEEPIDIFGRLYKLEGFNISNSGNGLFLVSLTEITDYVNVTKKYADERVAVAYIAIDNAEDIMQYVHEKFRDAVSAVDDKIKAWARSMGGVIKSYDNDKYLMFFDSARLDECIANRFEILDEIRDTRVGDGVSITVSIGVSRIEGTLLEREMSAMSAIDMALQRGGDQAVYKTDEGTEYFGGRTKSLYKRSSVRSRTFTNQLNALMVRADNVIIMGHRYGDFDSFGASIGISRLALLCGVQSKIAVDMRDKNIAPCIEYMQTEESYSQTFVDSAEAFDLISPDTLVVLVDHNTLERSQFSDISKKVNNVVILDHHRKGEPLPDSVVLSYIEPSASSTCELVTEMLENAISSSNLYKCEADMILAGILLDTKQFTRNTGTRTFAASQYLIGAGANPTDVYNLFKTLPEDLSKEARFHTAISVYKDRIAISSCDGNTDESYRIIASKAADKMLSLKGIDAAFTLVRIGEQIHISGRSQGKINVQIILERMGGGGHFDIAGAQIKSDSTLSVLESLKVQIDNYLDEIDN